MPHPPLPEPPLTAARRRDLAEAVAAGPAGIAGRTSAHLKAMRDLERRGLVTSRRETASDGVTREWFAATPEGAALAQGTGDRIG